MSLKDIDMNLLIVEAIEGYAYRHNLSAKETYSLFRDNNILCLIRENYDALHIQGMEESIYFVEDILRRMGK
jgi:hypothetical protein